MHLRTTLRAHFAVHCHAGQGRRLEQNYYQSDERNMSKPRQSEHHCYIWRVHTEQNQLKPARRLWPINSGQVISILNWLVALIRWRTIKQYSDLSQSFLAGARFVLSTFPCVTFHCWTCEREWSPNWDAMQDIIPVLSFQEKHTSYVPHFIATQDTNLWTCNNDLYEMSVNKSLKVAVSARCTGFTTMLWDTIQLARCCLGWFEKFELRLTHEASGFPSLERYQSEKLSQQ